MVQVRRAAHHYNQITATVCYVVLTKGFPYLTLDAIAIDRPGHISLRGYDTQPGLLELIRHKEKLEILVSDTF